MEKGKLMKERRGTYIHSTSPHTTQINTKTTYLIHSAYNKKGELQREEFPSSFCRKGRFVLVGRELGIFFAVVGIVVGIVVGVVGVDHVVGKEEKIEWKKKRTKEGRGVGERRGMEWKIEERKG